MRALRGLSPAIGPDATRVRLAGCGGVLLVVVVDVALGGGARGVVLLGAAALLTGVLAALGPGTPLVTITLLLLVVQHVDATGGRGGVLRVVAAMVVGALLWAVHAVHALAAVVPRGAVVDPVVLRRSGQRVVQALALSLPTGLLAAVAGTLAPHQHRVGLAGAGAVAGVLLLLVALRQALRAVDEEPDLSGDPAAGPGSPGTRRTAPR